MTVYDAAGRPVILKPTGRGGGEGQFFLLAGAADECAKIYHRTKLTPERKAKLRSMLANPPIDPAWEASRHHSIAWPRRLLHSDPYGSDVVGFTMQLIDLQSFHPLHHYYDTTDRVALCGGGFTWKYLFTTAQNLASSVAALHEKGHCVGDLRETNILVASNALLTLIDTDSFQIRDQDSGTTYYTRVGTGEYLPPELIGAAFSKEDRDRYHSDLFALAVLIFKLLMLGVHPYQARGHLVESAPTTVEKIRRGYFPYEPSRTGLEPPAYAPPYELLPPMVSSLFVRCFVQGHQDPKVRPTAAEWYRVLSTESQALQQCALNRNHWFSSHTQCPWCQLVASGNEDPFPAETGLGQQVALPGSSRPRSLPPPRPAQGAATAVQPVKTRHVPTTGLPAAPNTPPSSLAVSGTGRASVSSRRAALRRRKRWPRALIALGTGALVSWCVASLFLMKAFTFPYMSDTEAFHFTLALIGMWMVGGGIMYVGLRRVRVWQQAILLLAVGGVVASWQLLPTAAPVPLVVGSGDRWFDVARSGLCAVDPVNSGLWIYSTYGSEVGRKISDTGTRGFSWSQDGGNLVYATGGAIRIGRVSTNRAETQRVLPEWTNCSSPTWHPNGQEIAFVSKLNSIYRTALDGQPSLVYASESLSVLRDLDWSPDGTQIAFTRSSTGSSEICLVTLDGGAVRVLTRNSVWVEDPRWSPDGQWLAFVRYRSRERDTGECYNTDIWTMRADGSQQTRITHDTVQKEPSRWANEDQPVWSADGRYIFFADWQDRVFRVSATGGTPELVREIRG